MIELGMDGVRTNKERPALRAVSPYRVVGCAWARQVGGTVSQAPLIALACDGKSGTMSPA